MIWIIKDSSIGHTFFDEGAASFFLPHLTTPHQPVSNTSSDDAVVVKPLKRMRYMLDPVGKLNHWIGNNLFTNSVNRTCSI